VGLPSTPFNGLVDDETADVDFVDKSMIRVEEEVLFIKARIGTNLLRKNNREIDRVLDILPLSLYIYIIKQMKKSCR